MSAGKATLTAAGLRRIARTVDRVEREYAGPVPPQTRGGKPPVYPGMKWAIVGGSSIAAATAGTPPTPGHGSATIYNWHKAARTWSTGPTVDAQNMAVGTSGAVAAGTLVGLIWVDGDWWIIWVLC